MFGERFTELRKKAGYSQADMAQKLDVSMGAVAMWETNKRIPKHETLLKISDYFNVSVDYLLGKTDIKKPPVEITDEAAKDEFVGFYGDIKKDLTEGDLEDIKKLMRLRAELNRSDKE